MGAGNRHLKRKLQAEVSASEKHGMLKGCGILKAKKEALAAVRLLRFKRVPGGMDIWMDHWREMKAIAAATAAAAETASAVTKKKRKKRVVKQRVPKALIDLMVARPFRSIEDLTPAQLAKHSHDFRQLYALTTFVDGKIREYEQALVRQYDAQGYAEEESEATYDEQDACHGGGGELEN